ncbi:MAG: phosphoserine phosphatase SerB, partial [Candidatus Bathyarchaeia archaeon]
CEAYTMFLVILDFEGVLVKGEFLLELSRIVGKQNAVEKLTRESLEGRSEWKETLYQRIELLKGVEYEKCLQAAKALKLFPGAREFINVLKRFGNVKVGVITGCFDIVVDGVKDELGLDFAVANKLVFEDGKLAGVEVIVDANKDAHMESLARRYGVIMENVIAIGDGANDVNMIRKAGLGIAFNPAPVLTKYAKATVNAERLDEALPIIEEFIRKKQAQASKNAGGEKVKPKVLVCDPIDEEGIKLLQEFGFEVENKPEINYDELKKDVVDCDVLIVRSRTRVTKEIIDAGKNLKVIARAGAGVDNIDVEYAEKNGVKVICAPDAVVNSVAELTMGLILSLARQIPRADHEMKKGKWIKNEVKGWELRDKTIGIVGFGRIGQKVAQLAKAFGMKILIYDLNKPLENSVKQLDAQLVSFDELLSMSDIITLHVPLTEQTYHMIGKDEIMKMKDGVYLVNTSRGAIVDENALFEALKTGKVAGAALDVYEKEPPDDYAVIRMQNVVCTPHTGAQTPEAQKRASIDVATKIIQLFRHDRKGICEGPCQECVKF